MFKTILVAVDGSDSATKAFRIALDLAETYGASLSLLYVATAERITAEERRLAETEHLVDMADVERGLKPQGPMDGTYPLATFLNRSHEVGLAVRVALGQRILESLRKEAEGRGVAVAHVDVAEGDAAQKILEKAEAVGADAIAMGSRGFSDLKGAFLGSTSHKVSSRAPCSVLTLAA